MNSSSLLTAIILSRSYNNDGEINSIKIIKQFVLKIINDKFEIGEKIDKEFIIEQLNKSYGIIDCPIIILKKILKSLKSELETENNEYIYIYKSDEINKIVSKYDLLAKQQDEFFNELKIYLNDNSALPDNSNIKQIKNIFLDYLKYNGLNIAQNLSLLTRMDSNEKDICNFYIYKFLLKNYTENNKYYDIFKNIIEGYFISNTIYMKNSNFNQENLIIYLDTPIILCVLNLKTDEDNKIANETMKILKNNNSNIYIFKHNLEEVYNILISYKNRKLGFKTNDNSGYTLEYLDNKNLTVKEIENIIDSLEETLKYKDISINKVDTVGNENYCIGLDELTKIIKNKYKCNDSSLRAYNDALSIEYINILRKGNNKDVFNNSKTFFLTNNNYLINESNSFLNIDNSIRNSPCINNIYLISYLWSLNNKSNLLDITVLSLINAGNIVNKNFLKDVEKYVKDRNDFDEIDNNALIRKICSKESNEEYMKFLTKLKKNENIEIEDIIYKKEREKNKEKIDNLEKCYKLMLEKNKKNNEKEKEDEIRKREIKKEKKIDNSVNKFMKIIDIIIKLGILMIIIIINSFIFLISNLSIDNQLIKFCFI